MGGWLVEIGWLTTRKPGVKRSFVDLKIGPPKRRNWRSFGGRFPIFFVEVLKVYGEVSNHF